MPIKEIGNELYSYYGKERERDRENARNKKYQKRVNRIATERVISDCTEGRKETTRN